MPPAARPMPVDLTHRRPIVGAERTIVAKDCCDRYGTGQSIRSIAMDLGRSYGFIHRLLVEAGVTLRPRGGAQRRRRAT